MVEMFEIYKRKNDEENEHSKCEAVSLKTKT